MMVKIKSVIYEYINNKKINLLHIIITSFVTKLKKQNKNKNKTQIKFDITNIIHQTNTKRIITVNMNDVWCESLVKMHQKKFNQINL